MTTTDRKTTDRTATVRITITKVQTALWVAFLSYYVLSKFLAGFNGYSHAYAIQVGIIVLLTAILPYYLTRFSVTRRQSFAPLVVTVLPTVLAMTGYALFFFVFIAPYNGEVPVTAVVIRGLLPGVAVTVILSLPYLADRAAGLSAES